LAKIKSAHVPHTTGTVVAIAEVLTHPVTLSIHLAKTVMALVVYVGTVVLQGPVATVAHSKVVPAPQPVALIVPTVDGHIFSVIVMVGAAGLVHVPGTVVITDDVGLAVVPSRSQRHLVSIPCAGPVCA
jgi:hypothetical protein